MIEWNAPPPASCGPTDSNVSVKKPADRYFRPFETTKMMIITSGTNANIAHVVNTSAMTRSVATRGP